MRRRPRSALPARRARRGSARPAIPPWSRFGLRGPFQDHEHVGRQPRKPASRNGRRVVSTSIALMAAATPAVGPKQGVVGDGRRQCDGDGRHHRARRRELPPQQGQVGQMRPVPRIASSSIASSASSQVHPCARASKPTMVRQAACSGSAGEQRLGAVAIRLAREQPGRDRPGRAAPFGLRRTRVDDVAG